MNTCLQIIERYYGDKRAKRSGVLYMNHIYEGLAVLGHLGASKYVKDAYCLHPIFQDDGTFAENLGSIKLKLGDIDPLTLIFVMEYRNVANRGLNCFQIDDPDKIYLGPCDAVRLMLIADKAQNRKDFLKYHLGKHYGSKELDIYFKNWLRKLKVTEKDFDGLCKIMESVHKQENAEEDKPTCSFKQFEEMIGSDTYKVVPHYRYGQSVMNILHTVWNEEHNRISSTSLDCFYLDDRAKYTLEHLKQVWKIGLNDDIKN